jgi:hypothetical protein
MYINNFLLDQEAGMRRITDKYVEFHIIFLILFLAFISGCETTGKVSVPLPLNVTISSPVGTSHEIAYFSGIWKGVWDNTLDHTLVVEKIEGNEAIVIYAWGDAPAWNISRGFTRIKGKFEGNTLILKLARPATVTYRI